MEGLALVPLILAFGISGGLLGRRKGSSFWLWFFISAVPPFLGILAAFCYRYESDELRRQCSGCGRVVKLHDAVCMRCGTELYFPELAIAPESATPTHR